MTGEPIGPDRRRIDLPGLNLSGVQLTQAAALVAIALLYFSLTVAHGLELRDEGYFLALSRRAAAGELPNRDFVDIYGPAVYLWNGLLLRGFDMQVLAVRWSIAIIKALAVGCVFLAGSAVAPAGLAALATLLAIAAFGRNMWNLNTPYAALYVIALGLGSLVCMLRARSEERTYLYFVAGLLGGLAMLFKQSLAAMNGVALCLMIVAGSLLEGRPARSRLASGAAAVLLVALLAVPLVAHQVPFMFVGVQAYLLFFLPAHAMGLIVLLAALRAPVRAGSRSSAPRCLLALAAGAVLAPALVLSIYAVRGGLGTLLFSLISGPSLYASYDEPLRLPSWTELEWLVASVSGVVGGVLLLQARLRAAGACAALVAISAGVAVLTGDLPSSLTDTTILVGDALARVLATLCAYGMLIGCGWHLLRDREPPRWIIPIVYVFFWHHAITFQIFPRAGYNVFLALGAFMPGLAACLGLAWWALGGNELSGWRRAIGMSVLALPCLWPVAPAILSVHRVVANAAQRVALPFPETRGISVERSFMTDNSDLPQIVRYLKSQPAERPIFFMNNDWMILFLSDRVSLFRGDELFFYLMNWGMMNEAQVWRVDVERMIDQLASAPRPLVITKADSATDNIRRYMPKLAGFIDGEFVAERSFGPYRVLRRADAAGEP